ncbi:hypothetical protein M758_1G049700 [Ceratodon purpureus]|nr:hypothetical protein M758_1G049700 [Ceratodon purpureus]
MPVFLVPVSSPDVVYASKSMNSAPVKVGMNSMHAGSGGSRKVRGCRKKQQRDETPFTWKEQLVQLVAIFLTAAVVYKLTRMGVGWVEEARRPFCGGLEDPVRDSCRPCPENGICGGGELQCVPGFRRQGALCTPDKYIDRIAQYLKESVQSKVCRISGDSLCKMDETTWVPEHQLWDNSVEQKMGLDAHSSWLVQEKAVHTTRKGGP